MHIDKVEDFTGKQNLGFTNAGILLVRLYIAIILTFPLIGY